MQVVGGAVAVIAATVSMTNSIIANNVAGHCGGGVFMSTLLAPTSKEGASSFTMSSSTFTSNMARTGGGICSQPLENFLLESYYNAGDIYQESVRGLTGEWPKNTKQM